MAVRTRDAEGRIFETGKALTYHRPRQNTSPAANFLAGHPRNGLCADGLASTATAQSTFNQEGIPDIQNRYDQVRTQKNPGLQIDGKASSFPLK